MLVLVIDTAGSLGGVLLARDESTASNPSQTEVLGEGRLEARKVSTQLIPAITELLHANRLVLSDVDGFAVISGPGSFTGLRVGLSAVKAMAEVTEKPIAALSRLAVMASAAEASIPQEQAGEIIHTVLDAGRGEFYHGVYRDGGRACIAERLQTAGTLAASFGTNPGVVVASEAGVLDAVGTIFGVAVRPISAVTVREALPLTLHAWHLRRFCDVSSLDANYLRRLDVEGPIPKLADVPASGS